MRSGSGWPGAARRHSLSPAPSTAEAGEAGRKPERSRGTSRTQRGREVSEQNSRTPSREGSTRGRLAAAAKERGEEGDVALGPSNAATDGQK